VDGLYLHLIHAAFPTMSFIGVPMKVAPFPLFDLQARFVAASLAGRLWLPSHQQMLEAIREELEACADRRHFHVFAAAQWSYNDRLAEMIGCEPLCPVVRSLYEAVCPHRTNNLQGYRSQSFKIVDRQTFVNI